MGPPLICPETAFVCYIRRLANLRAAIVNGVGVPRLGATARATGVTTTRGTSWLSCIRAGSGSGSGRGVAALFRGGSGSGSVGRVRRGSGARGVDWNAAAAAMTRDRSESLKKTRNAGKALATTVLPEHGSSIPAFVACLCDACGQGGKVDPAVGCLESGGGFADDNFVQWDTSN